MFTISHDYYAILGVAKEATLDEIKSQYKRLMKKNHPDRYKGQRARCVAIGDEDLVRTLDERIAQAEEFCKLINEAFEILSDPVKRKQYDDQVFEPKVEEPKISVSPKTISFGTLHEGQKKSSTFTIKNGGGPAASVNIDWEGTKPDWGEIIIEPDENNTFPIKITVSVDTTGIPSGVKDDKILITVDGKVQTVEVFLSVARTVVPIAATPVSTPVTPTLGSGSSKSTGIKAVTVVLLLIIGCVVIGALVIGGNVVANQNQSAQATKQQSTLIVSTSLANRRATQDAVAATKTFVAMESEARNLVQAKNVVLLTEGQVMPNGGSLAGPIEPNKISFIQFTLVNNSKLVVGVSLPGCFPTSSIDGSYPTGYMGLFDEYDPGVAKNVTCFLEWNWGSGQNSPETYCLPEILIWEDVDYKWHICPYKK